MPSNGLGVIQIVTDIRAQSAYRFSTRDTVAALREIPGDRVGTTLTLPDSPESGDYYEFVDVDGSCSPDAPVTIHPSGATFLQGLATTFVTPHAWARITFDADAQTWVVISAAVATSAPNLAAVDQAIGAGVPIVATAPPGTIILRATLTPRMSGTFRVFGFLSALNALNTADVATVCLSHGPNPTAADFVGMPSPLTAGQARTGTLAVLFYYLAPFALGTPVQFNLAAFAGRNNSFLVEQHAAQFEVQEVA